MSSEYSYTRPKIDEVEIKPNPVDTGATVITSVSITPNPVDAGATYIITVEVSD